MDINAGVASFLSGASQGTAYVLAARESLRARMCQICHDDMIYYVYMVRFRSIYIVQ
jgi:hypothetical protein